MKTASKIAAKDSCNYALNKGNSNETNIKITPEIASLFGIEPKDGESYDVTFAIEKNDFLISHCQIMAALPLFTSKGIMVHFSEALFNSKLQNIEDFFEDQKTKNITAKLAKPKKHPICLNFGATKFNIRDFLVEGRSILNFSEKDHKVHLQVRYDKDAALETTKKTLADIELPHQQIFYGAPGTGKSHEIDGMTDKENSIRTTFHPDTDYASFIGAYKPTMEYDEVYALDATGKTHQVEYPHKKKSIAYKFVPQTFLKAYIQAWKWHVEDLEKEEKRPFFLVIEEINRGNCAQIFGDIFQLLDRSDNGFSSYAITPNKDIKSFLCNDEDGFVDIKVSSNLLIKKSNGKIIATIEDIKNGELMVLPPNLFILATMNTSDQSLFPIDSAFKRRWDWKYMPIANAQKQWTIAVNHKQYDWWEFLVAINQEIGSLTSSEDKKLGYFFCKAKDTDRVITAEKFVGKVIFYLWNDVFKDYEFEGTIFTDHDDNGKLSFNKFYTAIDHRNNQINEQKVEMFLQNLGLEPVHNEEADEGSPNDADPQAENQN